MDDRKFFMYCWLWLLAWVIVLYLAASWIMAQPKSSEASATSPGSSQQVVGVGPC